MNTKEVTIDADGKTLGRVASAAAKALLNKHSAAFAKNVAADLTVKIVNASKVAITGNKASQKTYVRYSGYPGGQKFERYDMLAKRQGHKEILRRAVMGMLPKNRLQKPRIKHLIIEG